jgi:hypothetical protein
MLSLNNCLVVEQYVKQEVKSQLVGGFAQMSHKIGLKPLKVLVDAKLADGTLVPAGSVAYVREEYLHLNSAANRNGGANIPTFTNEDICNAPFMIINIANVDIVDVKEAE